MHVERLYQGNYRLAEMSVIYETIWKILFCLKNCKGFEIYRCKSVLCSFTTLNGAINKSSITYNFLIECTIQMWEDVCVCRKYDGYTIVRLFWCCPSWIQLSPLPACFYEESWIWNEQNKSTEIMIHTVFSVSTLFLMTIIMKIFIIGM